MEEIYMRRKPTDPNLLDVTSDSDSTTDTDDDSETSDKPLLRKTTTITRKSLCLKGLLTLFALLFAAAVLATIFYFIGVGPWYLTHTRVTYGHSKYANFDCWNTSTTAIFMPWDNETSVQNRTGLFTKDNGKRYVESRAFNLNDSTLDNLLNRTWEIYTYDFLDTGVLCWIRVLQRKERRTVRCNWIHPDRGFPEWHCNMACRSLLLLPNQGYWDTEVVYPAPHRSSGCRAWLPRGEFWGDYHLNCREDVNITERALVNRTSRHDPRDWVTRPPPNDSLTNITAFLIRQGPRRFMYDTDQQHCYKHHFRWLNPCLWNKFVKCVGQNYIVLALEEYWSDVWHTMRPIRTEIETWLNNTFPWTYIAEDQTFFMGDFPEGTVRSHTGLEELHIANLRTQPLPTPDDLLNAPKNEFAKIDKCVAQSIFDSLNDTCWVKTHSSPRCDLVQTSNTFYSTWKYHCPSPDVLPTVKGALRAWYEDYYRNWDWEWWGLQKEELEAWVIPCLRESTNYWIRYQYLATVYSKERMIWPGFFWRPDNYVNPRPWRMTCKNNTRNILECVIGLARRPCQAVRGWERYCKEHYADEYDTHSSEVTWRKINGTWRRAIVSGKTCTDAILGYHLQKRKSIIGLPVPFIPNTLMAIAEGHAFRKSLCDGNVDSGFDWVGPNLLYSNLTCTISKEVWQKCGEGSDRHDCYWYEIMGSTLVTAITEVVEEVASVVEGGLNIVEQWLLSALSMLWPYLLGLLGIAVALVIGKIVLEAWLKALCRCKKRDYQPLPPKEEPNSA